jgi:phosphatidate cytidylyltransferase
LNNFTLRTITGLSLAFIVIFSLILNIWIFAGILLLVTVFGLNEFYSLVSSETARPQKIFGIVSGALWFIGFALVALSPNEAINLFDTAIGFFLVVLPILILFLVPFAELFRRRPNPLVNVAYTWFGLIYIPFPFSLLILLGNKLTPVFHGVPVLLLGYFILVWFYDTAAYLYGSKFGKHKFMERISPKKTWEGTIAGVIIAFLAATGFSFLVKDIPLADWFILTGIIIVFGTAGDLFESLIKRNLSIKDSGSILPGHGGILDRFDTVFISAPFVFLFYIIRLYFS